MFWAVNVTKAGAEAARLSSIDFAKAQRLKRRALLSVA